MIGLSPELILGFAMDKDGQLNWQTIRDNAHVGIHEMTVTGEETNPYDSRQLRNHHGSGCGCDSEAVGGSARGWNFDLARASVGRGCYCAGRGERDPIKPAAFTFTADWIRYWLLQDPKYDANAITPQDFERF
jgi:hypothetical protein